MYFSTVHHTLPRVETSPRNLKFATVRAMSTSRLGYSGTIILEILWKGIFVWRLPGPIRTSELPASEYTTEEDRGRESLLEITIATNHLPWRKVALQLPYYAQITFHTYNGPAGVSLFT